MAMLSGYTTAIATLPDRSRPDVLQLRPTDRSLFIGDAKATETPGNKETFCRLGRYATFLEDWIGAGGSGIIALAVAGIDAFDWLRVLRDLCLQPAGGNRVQGRIYRVDIATTVVSHLFTGKIA
ncbi:hypothetical protein [Mycobacterium colombiense]|uniref:hypothetical protein n=1 Tax=Mycobacterium colombiense TaxID=339268 RepID=UPI001153442A|nr:hypothetical protein [Mycobacterium colombiense]